MAVIWQNVYSPENPEDSQMKSLWISNGTQTGNKMGYNKDNRFYYADKHMPVVSLKIEYYDPHTDEPQFLPK